MYAPCWDKISNLTPKKIEGSPNCERIASNIKLETIEKAGEKASVIFCESELEANYKLSAF